MKQMIFHLKEKRQKLHFIIFATHVHQFRKDKLHFIIFTTHVHQFNPKCCPHCALLP